MPCIPIFVGLSAPDGSMTRSELARNAIAQAELHVPLALTESFRSRTMAITSCATILIPPLLSVRCKCVMGWSAKILLKAPNSVGRKSPVHFAVDGGTHTTSPACAAHTNTIPSVTKSSRTKRIIFLLARFLSQAHRNKWQFLGVQPARINKPAHSTFPWQSPVDSLAAPAPAADTAPGAANPAPCGR